MLLLYIVTAVIGEMTRESSI